MNFIVTVIALGIIVFVHELGHFIAALLMKVKVETFSLGFGPKILQFNHKGISFAVSVIPLGGYVKMKGENPDSSNNNEDDDNIDSDQSTKTEEHPDSNQHHPHDDDSFAGKKWFQKAFIAFAGPFFNLLLALFLIIFTLFIGTTYSDLKPIIYSADYPLNEYFQSGDEVLKINNQPIRSYSDIFKNINEGDTNYVLILRGQEELNFAFFITNKKNDLFDLIKPFTTNMIGEVSTGLPAWKAGLKKGDRIIKVDDTETNNWYEVRESIINSENIALKITILRENQELEFVVTPEIQPISEQSQKIIGIYQSHDLTFHESYNFFDSIKIGSITTISYIYLNYKSLYKLIKNPSTFKNSVGGPIMVYYLTSQTTQKGISELLLFVALINIIMMIMNLLPIPVLDGGHIIFCFFEGIFRRPLPIKAQIVAQQIGLFILLSLMFYAFYSDILRFFIK